MAQDVFSKMAEEQWILNEDGYLNVDTNVKEIVYHPYLNVILICTYSGEVKVLDVNSGVILQSSYLSALNLTEVKCKYIPSLDRVLFTDGQALGVRSDYNGVLLLDSILQKTTGDSKEEVKLELPLSEAIILKESFSSNLTSVDHIINELTDVILKAQKYLRRGIKAQKWNTVCLNIPLEDLRVAAADIVSILLTKKEHVPELGVASAVQERLADLLGEKVNASDRKSMASEWRRRETYSEWPHMDYKWALPDQMAQAGFYHQPNSSGDDRAMCFTCTVCLVCWERTDEPCSEHERHSPTCPFVVGEYTQNVPLSVTHATCPAVDCTHRGLAVEVVGDSSEPHLVPTATADGLVSVFDVAGKVKRAHSFYVTQFDSFVLDRFTKDFGQVGILAIAEHRKYPVEKKITSLCIVSTDSPTKNPRSVRPSLVCGLSFTTHLDKFPKITHMDSDDAPITRLYLVVYDFLYHTDPYRPDPFDDASPVLAPCPPDDEDDATPSDAEKVSNLFNLNSSDLGGEDLPGYNLMKQLSSFYESFVPGESDEVFLPPPQKPHSGPRVLLFDEFKTDSSSTGQPMTNGQLTGMEGELSISDHINELKNTQSPKKLSYSRPVQCVGMPEQCRSLEGAEISAVLPTPDRRHVLVVVRGAATALGGGAGGFLVLYALDASDRAMRLDERPVATRELAGPERPEEVHLLPPIERLGAPEGNAVMVCADGVVRIISLATLRTVCFAQIEDDAFVSVAYCNSLDRLCASTKKGSLHFYALTNADNESSDDHDDDDPFGAHAHDASTGVSQQLDALDNSQLARHFRRPAAPVAPPDLRDFRSLCDFEPLKTGYCVVVPPCWSEFQQSLRQRRQPNAQKEDIGTAIINTHGRKYCEGDGEQTMKTWRLLTDITTWDEHIFEITLPNATLLGHLDVHFTLQPSSCAPQVEVTLLRQNKSGIGHKKDVKFSVDETVTIEMLQWVDNPVVSQEYLRAHNAEILVGPIDVSSYLDLTEQCGIITMTSPKLYKTKVRNLLLHVRAVNSKDDVARSRPRPDKPAAAAATGVDKLGLASPRKADFYMGCDVIHELSVALHTLRASQVPNDRTQRSLMLESDVFAQALVLTALSDASPEVINHSLDILDWIAATRLTRNRSNNGEAPNQQFEFLGVVEENLASLTKKCLLHGGRSIAHKCVRLIMTCCRGAENIGPARADAFSSAVLAALLSLLDSIEEIDSSAGLQWLFALLSKVTPMAEEAAIVDRCVGLLGRVAGELSGRSNPYHLLLRGRYGLYGTPMEPELFDVEPPQCTRGEASLLASQTGADLGAAQYSFNRESINPKDVLSTSPTKLKSKNIVSQRIIHGLIETQPLHFACASASEGTRVERADAFAAAPLSYLSALLPVPATGGGGATSNDSPAGKKEYMEKLMDSVGKMMKAQLKGKTPLLVGGAGGGGSGTSNANDGGGGGGGSKWVSIFSEPDNIEADVDGKLGEDYGVDDTVFINITKKLEEASGITGTLHPPITTSAPPTMAPPNLLPWQQLLAPPPRQVIVVERMHSGARRHVMLDFGRPVLLTDVLVPACADLVSVAVDVWLDGEDADEGRLAVAADIGSRSLLLSDLQPPPLCQFVKITVVGRYGMSTMRSRIPLGHFYGHLVVLPDEVPPHLAAHTTDPDKQSAILGKLFEDLSCRYSLACSRLKELLRPLLAADLGNAVHLAAYIGVARECGGGSNVGGGAEHGKVAAAYQETVKLQHQLNIVKNVIGRVERSLGGCNAPTQRSEPSTDKLAAIAENLLEILLSMDATAEMPRALCQQFFLGLCMTQPPRLQLLAAIFLERHCGRAAYWGDFLADTLADAFATSCSSRFPQDRLFVLLAYLSRRSPEKSAVIDAAMRVVHDALRPLTGDRRPLLATTVDLPLISWQLMYLSLQLSLCKVQGGSQHRWNWVMGEMVGGKGADNPKGSNKKKNCKRMAQPGNSGGMQSYPTYSSVVINAETQSYQQKLKSLMVQDKLFRLKHFKKVQDDNRTNKDKKDQAADRPSAALRMPQIVDSGHCLLVAKGLLRLILCMDHSSSADMLLLSFKVVSKLVTLGKLQLGQLLEESELLELITFCISCRIPWAPFALTCFLQDAMELTQLKADEVEMETETSSSASWSPNEAPNDADTTPDNFNMEMLEPAIKPTKPSASIISNNTFPPLPSVYESEDSEFEELLDDLQKVRCTANSKSPKAAAAPAAAPNSGLSCAADSRLELGVQALSEIDLKKLVLRNTQVLLQAATAEMGHKESDNGLNPWPGPVEVPAAEAPMTNQAMLNRCFTSLFEDLQNQDASKIEHILQLWLTLNNYSKFLPSTIPQIALDAQSVRNLISTMAWTPGLSLTAWCSALRTLTLVCNMNGGKKWMDLSGMADTIVTHPDFVQLFLSLLSGTGPVFNGKTLAGPSLCRALHDLLVRLQMRCDIVSPVSQLGNLLKTSLLKVVYQLAQPSGSVASRLGPLDAQCKLLQTMLYLYFINTDLSIAMSTLESTATLVYSYVLNKEKIECGSVGEKQGGMANTFSDIFASVLGPDTNKDDRPVSYEDLLILMLKLMGKLVQTPLPDQLDAMDTESATDESKAERILHAFLPNSLPCFADIVLQNHPTVIRLCRCLAACKSSSLCMLANVTEKVAISNMSDPNTVGDAIFHLLTLLARKASAKELLLNPLLAFLNQTPQLSEPLLWFVLQVLENEDAIKKFLSLDGISVLGASIVASANSPSTLLKTGTISTVMQHFSGVPATVPLDPTYVVTATGGASATAAAAAPTKKALQASSSEGRLSMVNFAPFCTISCLSTTAQSADGLIQFASGVTHRRARAPLWSYHFYPDESHTELLLQLPSAVLLKEVHLQPHAAGLSTCPSFVALEVSAYGPLRLTPACLPLPTSGLTHIRLHLPVPRVANCVLLRLYRPRDANSIGLLQVRLLGSHAFSGGGPAHCPDADDEAHCDHSLGWLRLLHHCLTLAAEPELRRRVVERASRVPNLLATCCGLLLVPSHVLPVYLPCLERVLREVALFSPENGMHTMRVLLESRAGVVEPLMVLDAHWQDRLINVAGYQSACELLFQICEHQDPHTSYRVKILLDWLEATSNQALATGNTDNCNPAYISSIASILWSAKHSQVHYDLESLVTIDLFRAVHGVRTRANCSTSLKHSIDSLMCSACHVRPELYALLLQQVGVPCGRAPSASISDDRKDAQGMTDDSKRHSGWYGPHLDLTREQLDTVALVSRSPTAVQQLLDSGLPRLLNAAILDFCGSATARVDSVTSVLQFFTDVSDEKAMRDWLGSEEGSSFWLPLLQWLCRKPSTKSSSLQTEALVYLEEVCVRFLAKCCLCHHQNQARLAKVLCDVIYSQSNGISGFMRRLILQLLLETEKIPVSVEADEALYPSAKLVQAHIPAHPAFKQTHNRTMLCLGTNTTLSEILEQHVLFNTTCKTELVFDKKAGSAAKKDIFKSWFAADEQEMSMAAGVTAKDKRAKDAKNMLAVATPQSKKKRYASGEAAAGEAGEALEGRGVRCEALSEQPLPLTVNLGQLLRMIEAKGAAGDWPYVHLKIYQCKNNEDKPNGDKNSSTFQQQPPICSALQVFSSMGGLALLAQHLPTIYPEAIRPPQQEKPAADQSDSDWIKVEDCDDMYEDMMEEAMGSSSPSKSSVLISHIPPHSLTAFGLFLRLPGYAEVLLKDMKRALYLLRLILGVTDDGEGGDIFNSPISDSLPTLPFEVLKKLYDATPLSTDDGRLLRRISINFGVVHLLLACLSIFTHHSSNSGDKDQNNKSKEERSQLYWAKGTGFGTGSTQQSWNVEQALMKQRNEEEHVTVLLQVLASYINPNDEAEEELGDNVLPLPFHELLTQSALLPAICSYLRNDSVLDMARHIPLYKAVLQLLRSLAVSSQLVGLLLPQKKSGDPSVSSLLKNMKTCVDTYASKLRLNSRSKSKSKLSEQMEDLEQGEGLATLMPDIQNTANLVSRVTSGLVESDCSYDNETSVDRKVVISLDEQYLRIMKNLQFASFEMISELPDGGIKFVVSHHFESNAKTTGEQSHPARVKRIAQEAVTLSTSLPLSYSSSVFVRYDTSRLDVMKVLITGPSDTPYANGCFELDVFFPPDYPLSPMMINLETTGHHTVRFNPNLYNDGKVCLSVLNTWHGRPEEKWNAQTSSFLQVLVSIQSLILVPEPYFNEPGYERARGTPAGTVSSRDYNLNICQSTVRWAMLEQILNPCPCFRDVVHAHFYVKRHEVIAQVERWIAEVEQEVARDKKVARSGKKSPASTLDTFRKVFEQLKDELAKLRPPPELEEEEEPPQTPTNDMEVAIEVHHEDEDKDMEKMVNEMCD